MPLSMITVVAKQDLWYEHRDEVRAFYENGKYAETIGDLKGIKGAQNFQHEFVFIHQKDHHPVSAQSHLKPIDGAFECLFEGCP